LVWLQELQLEKLLPAIQEPVLLDTYNIKRWFLSWKWNNCLYSS